MYRHTSTFLAKALFSSVLTATITFPALAEEASTVPEGYVVVTIAAGTGSVRVASLISLPLQTSPAATGEMSGTLSGVTSTTLSNANADWGNLVTQAQPAFVQITTGAMAGRFFQIASNTATTLTLNTSDGVSGTPVDLVALGVVAGDQYRIVSGDTLLSTFGAGNATGLNAPLGNADPNLTDYVQINTDGSWSTYSYDLSRSAWINLATEALANHVVIRPDAAVIYNRLANSSFSLTCSGRVPDINRRTVLRSGQTTLLSSYWPTPVTLSSLSLQTIPTWASNSDLNLADLVLLRVGSSWFTFAHDGSNWINVATEAIANNQQIEAGSGMIIRKKAVTNTAIELTQNLPYNLN